MKMRINICLIGILTAVFSSCIKDEPLYREADIVDMVVEDDAFLTRGISENSVQLVITDQADYTKIVPLITLSPGATVSPASGVPQDFSKGKTVNYRVTAEDGVHYKDYTVTVIEKISLRHEFEDWTTAGSTTNPYPILEDLLWANANSGVVMAMIIDSSIPKGIFPTSGTTDCVSGEYAARMETLKGASKKILGNTIPIFPGSIFRGSFSANMSNPLKSLHLGVAHPKTNGAPSLFTGFYKYTPGEVFTDKEGNEIPGRIDEMSMYAVIFKIPEGTPEKEKYLDGETVLISDWVVGRAEWKENDPSVTLKEASNGFTEFSIPFIYTEDLDFDENVYKLTIVCSSSKDGNEYMGAIGSILIVDNLEIICDPIK